MSYFKQIKIVAVACLVVLTMGACATESPSSQPTGPKSTDDSDPPDRPTLSLIVSANDDDVVLDVRYGRPDEAVAPRIAELVITHSPGLAFGSCQKGYVLEQAQKNLIVQKRNPGELRAVAYSSSNLLDISSGILMTCQFERIDAAPQEIGLSTQKPIFAPAEANTGLLVDDNVVF